jgi:predicted GIY-YIG superfamily endonuclease
MNKTKETTPTPKQEKSREEMIEEINILKDKLIEDFDAANRRVSSPERFWSYVYIIKCHDLYKIGITYNLNSRFNTIQVGNPYPLEIVYSIKHPRAIELEKYLHEYFRQKRELREWFKLDKEDIETIKKITKEMWE